MATKNIKEAVGGVFEVLTSYPSVDATKAGQIFIYKNELWRYLLADESNYLPIGTPFPLKGYKERLFSFWIDTGDSNAVILKEFTNDYDASIGVTRNSAGIYQVNGTYNIAQHTINISQSGIEEKIQYYINIDDGGFYDANTINILSAEASGDPFELELSYAKAFVSIKQHLNQVSA